MAKPLVGKTIVLGITGSIAAYKGAEVARRLMDLGAEVHATLTQGGAKFITPLTLRSLTGNPVTIDMFEEPQEWEIKHISLAQRAAAVVIAPASANAIAKLALGMADEFIYTVALATQAPLLVAPAMNDRMFAHPITQENLARLRARGVKIIEPETGRLASGAVGTGRLADPTTIAAAVAEVVVRSRELEGVKVLVTAGPTREALDPVRFLTNRSSGKMGYALAEAAAAHGADVTLVSGPACLTSPADCELVRVETTQEMYDEVVRRFEACDIFISAGAPADYTPIVRARQKLKKASEKLLVELAPTPDILAECGRRKKTQQFLVGFAAETEKLEENAAAKLQAKNLDLIVANEVGGGETGFESDRNAGVLLFKDGNRSALPAMDKRAFAEEILRAVVARRLGMAAKTK